MNNQTPYKNQSKLPSFGGVGGGNLPLPRRGLGGGNLPLPRRGAGGGLLIVIVGPTAIGKTSLSIDLAKHFNCEILSADSRQFYKEMRIGTAVPTEDELSRAKHHFIQHLSIHDDYSVGDYERDAIKKLDEIFQSNNIAILVGGSGLYVNAVLYGLDDFPEVDKKVREKLNIELNKNGINTLQEQLKELDLETYQNIDLKNPQRLIRALEICIGTGKKFSSFKGKKQIKRNFTPIFIGLTAERALIYQRIEQRVDLMMREGLLEEAKALFPFKDLNALQTVGYRELFAYFEGKIELPFAVSEIKKNTRRFAKRQLTWFNRDKNIQWFDYIVDIKKIVLFINNRLNE